MMFAFQACFWIFELQNFYVKPLLNRVRTRHCRELNSNKTEGFQSGSETRCVGIEGMGCASSKKLLRTKSFQQNLHRPFPRVAAIPIIEEFLLANNHEQFVALICKNNNFTNQIPAAAKQETLPSSISKDNEGKGVVIGNLDMVRSDLKSGSTLRVEELENHKPAEEESEKHEAAEEESEKHKAAEEESEKHKAAEEEFEKHKDAEEETEKHKASEEESEEYKAAEEESEEYTSTGEDKPEIINTWELMEGLEDGEADEKPTDNNGWTRVLRTAGRSKSMECFHTLEEYDAVLDRSKTSLWDRKSKRYFYYLGHRCLEIVTKSALSSVFRKLSPTPKPPKPRKMTPTVIDWKEDSKADHNCALESSVRQASSEQRDKGNEVSSPENNSIAEIVPENTSSQENNHLVEAKEGNIYSAEINLETVPSTEKKISKRSLHERAKVNDLGGISIPSTPQFSAVGSLRDWLNGGGHLYSPGVSTTPTFGSYSCGDRRSILNTTCNFGRFLIDEAESEICSSSALEMDKQASNIMDSGAYSDSSLSAIEKENWDNSLFDPELLASFERALEQLSEEEKCLLRQIDDSLHFPCSDCHSEDSEDSLHDSSRMGDIPIQNNCPSYQEEFSIQIPRMSENPQEVLAAS